MLQSKRLKGHHLSCASGLVNACTRSMKSRARGLGDRFFRVTIATGMRVSGNSTGKALSHGCLRGSLSENPGSTERNLPFESNSLRRLVDTDETVSRGGASPQARNTSAWNMPKLLSSGPSTHGSFIKSESAILRLRVNGFLAPATMTEPLRKRVSELCSSATSRGI